MVTRVLVALLERRGERGNHVAVPELQHGVAVFRGAAEDHGLGARRRVPAPARPAPLQARTRAFVRPPAPRYRPRPRFRESRRPRDPRARPESDRSAPATRRRRSRAARTRTRRPPSGRRDRGPASAPRSGRRPRPGPRRPPRSRAPGSDAETGRCRAEPPSKGARSGGRARRRARAGFGRRRGSSRLGDQRTRWGEPTGLLFQPADLLPGSRELLGKAFSFPRTHVRLRYRFAGQRCLKLGPPKPRPTGARELCPPGGSITGRREDR